MTEDLVSVRGLIDSEFDEIVRSFDGIFDGYETAKASGYEGTRIDLKFKDIDNVIAVSPYNFPTKVINMGLSNKNGSKWGIFSNSLTAFIPDDEDIKDCIGRKMSLVYTDGVDGRPKPKPLWNSRADVEVYPDKIMPTPVWIVTAIEGGVTAAASGESASEWAEENLIGKTKADFNKWAMADQKVRGDKDLQRSIVDKSFITGLVTLNKVVEDGDGVFQRPS